MSVFAGGRVYKFIKSAHYPQIGIASQEGWCVQRCCFSNFPIIGSNFLWFKVVRKIAIPIHTKEFLDKLKILNLPPNSLYRFANFIGSFAFLCSVNHLSEGGVNGNYQNETRSASFIRKNKIDNDSKQESSLSLALDCLRIAKKIAMMSGIFVEGRSQALLYFW